MQHSHHVEGGGRLAKTIIFARYHHHAKFIEERFNHHYSHLEAGHFARVIDNKAKYAQSLIDDFSEKNKPPSLAWFVKSMVSMERTAAQTAFAEFLNDRSLSAQQIRFVEMVIDQLTARGVMKDSALYEAPFNQLHAGGPDELFAGKEAVVDSLFATLSSVHIGLSSAAAS